MDVYVFICVYARHVVCDAGVLFRVLVNSEFFVFACAFDRSYTEGGIDFIFVVDNIYLAKMISQIFLLEYSKVSR